MNILYDLPVADGVYCGVITVYKGEEITAKRFCVNDGLEQINDKTSEYTLELFPHGPGRLTVNSCELPEAVKIKIINDIDDGDTCVYLYINGDCALNSDVELTNVELRPLNSAIISTIYIRSRKLTFSGMTVIVKNKINIIGEPDSLLKIDTTNFCELYCSLGVGSNPNKNRIIGSCTYINCMVKRPLAPDINTRTSTSVTLCQTTGYKYKLDNGAWQSSPTFNGLEAGKTYKFYQKAPATASLSESEPSPALVFVNVASPSAPDAPVLSVRTDVSIILKNDNSLLEYRCGTDGVWQSSCVFEGLSPDTEYKFYARIAQTSLYYASDPSEPLTVRTKKSAPAAPSAPEISEITKNSVTFVAVEGCDYGMATVGNNTNSIVWYKTNTINGLNQATKYYFFIRYSETDDRMCGLASPYTEMYSLYSAPTPPTVSTIDTTSVTLDAAETGTFEYRVDGGAWQSAKIFSGLNPATEYSFSRRIGGEIKSEPSADVKATTKKYDGKAASAPTLQSKTDTAVVLKSVAGCEYRMDDGEWQASASFTGLTGGTEYTFYQRYSEDATHYVGAASDGLTVTTDKSLSAKPAAPTLKSRLDTKIILVMHEGYEYKCGTGAWQTSNVFAGLAKDTEYTFYQRVADGKTCFASEQSDGFTVKTLSVANLNSLKNNSSGIVIDDDKNLVSGVALKTTVSAMLSNFTGTEIIKIIDGKGNDITNNSEALVGTGTKLCIMDGDVIVEEKTVIIIGDVTGDGKIDVVDCMQLRAQQLGKKSDLTGVYLNAGLGVVSGNTTLGIVHYMKLRALQLGKITSFD